MAKASAKTPAKKTTPKGKTKILYPTIQVCGVEIPPDQFIITAEQAKAWLGWEEEPEGGNWGDDYFFKLGKVKIRLNNNKGNRAYKAKHAAALCQDILNGCWQMNCENIIIGRTGRVLSGQHRLLSLILAVEEWAGKNKMHWKEYHKKEPVIKSLWVVGCEESQAVVQTLDNVQPRTLADVIQATGVFSENPEKQEACAKVLENAVKFLWKRTGKNYHPFKHHQTHSSSLEFVNNHPKLLDSIKYITGEPGPAVRKWLPPGMAAAVHYLMASSASNVDAYRAADTQSEESMDFSLEEKATEFWGCLLTGAPDTKPVGEYIGWLGNQDDGQQASQPEIRSVLAKAWSVFSQGHDVTKADLKLEFTHDDYGFRTLPEESIFGGIDLGPDYGKSEDDDTEEEPEQVKEEIKKGKQPKPDEPEKDQTIAEMLAERRLQHPASVLLFTNEADDSPAVAWDYDATAINAQFKALKVQKIDGVAKVKIPHAKIKDVIEYLQGAGRAVTLLQHCKDAVEYPAPKKGKTNPKKTTPAKTEPSEESDTLPFDEQPTPDTEPAATK